MSTLRDPKDSRARAVVLLARTLWNQFTELLPTRPEFAVGRSPHHRPTVQGVARRGISEAVHAIALQAHDRMIGLGQ
ncbi:hypothetical protein ACIHIX_34045 [Streptomyces sp. NPDC051913]|uniref:hypothetical protein n=1 Tax=Streptomyces sp. NPDC051913 TaxID=3365676 RepID=UPI0037D24FC5